MTDCVDLTEDVEPLATLPASAAGTPADTSGQQPVLRGYGVVLAALLALLAVGATLAAVSGTVRHEMILSLVRQPEKYTVLYFSDGLKQATLGPDRVAMTVCFTVVNHEGKATRFPYAVQVVDRAKTPIVRKEGSVQVADGGDATARVDVKVPVSAEWSAVEVNLLGRTEHIRLLQSPPEATGD